MIAFQQLRIRRLEPDEAGPVQDAVFGRLSLESRRRRFLIPMVQLPDSWRRRLAQVDGSSHVAIAAWAAGEPVAIGRFVSTGSGDVEVAIEVVDDWQGRGIGQQVIDELVGAATRLGYRRLVADVLDDNAAMLHLLRKRFPAARLGRVDGLVRFTVDIE